MKEYEMLIKIAESLKDEPTNSLLKDRELDDYTGLYVLLSTDETKRGVFFGKLMNFDKEKKTAILDDCQMAVKWSMASKGFNSLAVDGPQEGSRITKPVLRQNLDCVSCIVVATEEAKEQWKKCLWDD
jgi:hypothetical protein